jgi:peptidoglycan/LPS O-acetylase OafA/YrhL
MKKSNDLEYIPELDGIRGIAIIMVLLWHYGNNQVIYELNLFTKYFRIASSMFWSGVDLFFVLSGFLIGRILLNNRDTRNYFRTFYIRRIFRIFPLYYLSIVAFFLLHSWGLENTFVWLMKDPFPFWTYALFIQNFAMSNALHYGPSWLGITWSLAIEEQFYLILPLVIFLIADIRLVYLLLMAVLLAFVYRILYPGITSHVSLIGRIDTLASGVLLAYVALNKEILNCLTKNKKIIYIVFAILLFGVIVFSAIYYDDYKSYVYSWLTLLYTLFILIPLIDQNSFISSMLRNRILKQIGILSFGIYLYHQLITGILHQIILKQTPRISTVTDLSITFLSFILTIIIAHLSYMYLEKPFLKLGRKYNYQD